MIYLLYEIVSIKKCYEGYMYSKKIIIKLYEDYVCNMKNKST